MRLYFTGGEVAAHRELLHAQGVKNIAVSFTGVRKRPKLLADLSKVFPDDVNIFLDSGAYSLNKGEQKYSVNELLDISVEYYRFVEHNLARITMFSEFDAQALGPGWIANARIDDWKPLSQDKFLPVWHREDGLPALERLSTQYPRIGIMETDLDGRNLAPVLNKLAGAGVKLHAMATKPDDLREIRWDSAASTSWLSPSQYGDTIVWTGKTLKRYPKKYKDQARLRHRTLFTREGFDAEAIERDDTNELLKVSIWSWLRLEEDIMRHEVTNTSAVATRENAQNELEVVANSPTETLNPVPRKTRIRDSQQIIPILGIRTESNDAGEDITTPYMRSESTRVCDSCFLSSKCEAYQPGYNCAYSIPIDIRTRDDYRRLYDMLIKMQADRVVFMRLAEEAEGGYADPNLSQEITRLDKLIQARHDMDQEGFTLTVNAKAQGQSGVFSRLFGAGAGAQVMSLPHVIDADEALRAIEGGR